MKMKRPNMQLDEVDAHHQHADRQTDTHTNLHTCLHAGKWNFSLNTPHDTYQHATRGS